jgi:hypothetical protein
MISRSYLQIIIIRETVSRIPHSRLTSAARRRRLPTFSTWTLAAICVAGKTVFGYGNTMFWDGDSRRRRIHEPQQTAVRLDPAAVQYDAAEPFQLGLASTGDATSIRLE